MNTVAAPHSFVRLKVAPLTPSIGAEIPGIDLACEQDDATIAEIRAALLAYKVVFFRDQFITAEQHIAFARRFGPLEIHPATPQDQANREVLHIAHGPESRGRENFWHSDVTWRAEPSLGSILRAIEVPDVGGDTLFADMAAAFRTLSPAMQDWCRSLSAVHDIARVFAKRLGKSAHELHEQYPPQLHPVVRTHPETGEQALYVNTAFTSHIEGLSGQESEWLLAHLYAQAAVPEIQCRFRWRAGSIVFWDNRAAQHYAASDYFPAVRRMERVTIAGDRPFYRDERGRIPAMSDEKVVLLSGGNPQIAKGYGDAPVQAYIAAMPGWKSAAWARLDRLIEKAVPGVAKAVKWNSPFYGAAGQGEAPAHWFLSIHCFDKYIKVAFFRGQSLDPVPPVASKSGDTRYFHIHEGDKVDEAAFADWVKQAAALPGEKM